MSNLKPGERISWLHFALDAKEGVEREGEVWSLGPVEGGMDNAYWVVPDEAWVGDQYSALLVAKANGRKWHPTHTLPQYMGGTAVRVPRGTFISCDSSMHETGSMGRAACLRALRNRSESALARTSAVG